MLNRRNLFIVAGSAAVAPASMALPSVATQHQQFVQSVSVLWGERGRKSAVNAVAAGMDPSEMISAMSLGDDWKHHPTLVFKMKGGSMRTFGPHGEAR